MVPVKKAVTAALAQFEEVFNGQDFKDVRLEEVELSEDGRFWLVTLGYLAKVAPQELPTGPLADALTGVRRPTRRREYKTIKIDADDGAVTSIKIRSV